MKKKSRIPKFNSYTEEAEFWDTHSVADFLDELTPVKINFKANLKKDLMSIRLTKDLKKRVEAIAHSYDISVSSLVRLWVVERLQSQEVAPVSVKKSSKNCP